MTGARSVTEPKVPRWKFWMRVVAVFAVLYVVGYFPLMDRHRPTSPSGAYGYFQSSYRWADDEWIQHPAMPEPKRTPYPDVSILNVIYEPMDKLYFWVFPRSESELDKLGRLGYPR